MSLDATDIEAIADAVVDRLGRAAPEPLLDVAGMAALIGVREEWVRDHADELGVLHLGNGERPRLRFDRATALQRLAAKRPQPESTNRRQRRSKTTDDVELLPIGGRRSIVVPEIKAGRRAVNTRPRHQEASPDAR